MSSAERDPLKALVPTCRSRLRQVLEGLDGRGSVPTDEVLRLVETSRCAEGHELHYAALMQGLVQVDEHGLCRLARAGTDWLDEEGRPSPNWRASIAADAAPLRAWQVEALRAWTEHGRRGVVEAVTGTGKSRVGIEAAREALSEDYSVVIVVPTRDLVEQWVAALRAQQVPGVGVFGEGASSRFDRRRVVVGTVQSLYLDPPVREDGKVLLVADECHRYGAGQWRRALHPSYRRRLGLTATFERNDDGIQELLTYFGGSPVYSIGFDRAIADGVVAHYDVKLLGVTLYPRERADYDRAHDSVVDSRMRLLSAGFTQEPFGLFLQQVSEAAEDPHGTEDPTVVEVARRYLKAFSERIEILSSAAAKMEAVRALAPRVENSTGSLLFTRTVDAAEEIAAVLTEEGVAAEPLHSGLTSTMRRERLASLRAGRLRAIAAPTVLDEGVDVPAIDLAVVLGGSKSRRQMIQRMGRVLRLKDDGRSACFIVVYARDTVEDLTQNDGQEGCLDLILRSADSVEHLSSVSLQMVGEAVITGEAEVLEPARLEPETTLAATDEVGDDRRRAGRTDPQTLPMTRAALEDFQRAHGGDDAEAESALRETLSDLSRFDQISRRSGYHTVTVVRGHDFEISFTHERFLGYRCRRDDGLSWPEVKHLLAASRPSRSPEAWVDQSWPESPVRRLLIAELRQIGPLTDLIISDRAVDQHRRLHGGTADAALQDLQCLLSHVDRDPDRCARDSDGRLVVGRSGYWLTVDPILGTVSGYDNGGQHCAYSDYLDFGRLTRRASRLPLERPDEDSALEVEKPPELLDYIDVAGMYYSNASFRQLLPLVDDGHLNDWDIDRSVRLRMFEDLTAADDLHHLSRGSFGIQGRDVLWVLRGDGLSVAALRDPDALTRLQGRDGSDAHAQPDGSNPADDVPSAAGTDPFVLMPLPESHTDSEASPVGGRSAAGRAARGTEVVAQIERLVELKKEGYLTDEEFAAAKAKVLG